MMKIRVYLIFTLLIILECLRVYLIMPMPGSQKYNSIEIAYFLNEYKNVIRCIGFLLLAFPCYKLFKNGIKKDKIIIYILCIFYFIIFYLFSFKMQADKIFYQPKETLYLNIEKNKVLQNKIIIGIDIDGIQKAYPIQFIGYHHQVKDTINNKIILVTYCTVCRTGRVYSSVVNGVNENFRLVGMDHFNALFEDATTKSWWRQSNGECIAGKLKGYKLPEIKSEQVSLSSWARIHPNTLVFQPDTNFKDDYEKMDSYDKGLSKGSLTKRDTSSWKDKSWILGIQNGSYAKAYDWNKVTKLKIIQDELSGLSLLILLENDSTSFHVYNRKLNNINLNFSKNGDTISDLNTGSIWNYDGFCIDGKLKGSVLTKIYGYQEFLHSWEFSHPNSKRF